MFFRFCFAMLHRLWFSRKLYERRCVILFVLLYLKGLLLSFWRNSPFPLRRDFVRGSGVVACRGKEKQIKLRIAARKVSLKITIDEAWQNKNVKASSCKRNTLMLDVAPSGIWDLGSSFGGILLPTQFLRWDLAPSWINHTKLFVCKDDQGPKIPWAFTPKQTPLGF